MLEMIAVLVVAVGLVLSPAYGIRALARIPKYWTFIRGNCFQIIVSEDVEDSAGTKDEGANKGGNIVNLLHAIDGYRLEKHGTADYMEWELVPGNEPGHDTFFYQVLGVQSMRNIFNTARTNIDRRLRFGRNTNKPDEKLHAIAKDRTTKNVEHTGEFTVVIDESDTADGLGVNLELEFGFRRRYPVRTVIKFADSAAFVTSLVEETTNKLTVGLPAEGYVGSQEKDAPTTVRENREALIQAIADEPTIAKKVSDATGFDITTVSLRSISMTAAHRAIITRKVDAQKAGEALVITATAEREAGIKRNDVEADRITRVIKPMAESPLMVTAGLVDVLKTNKTLTHITYAPGAGGVVPLGGDRAS